MKKCRRLTLNSGSPWSSTGTFTPLLRRLPGLTVVNAGSVSQSYDGDRRAAYAVIDGANVTIRRVEYDVRSEAKELLRSGLPHAEWLSQILLAGKYCPPERSEGHEGGKL